MTVDGKSGSWQLSRSAHASSQQPDRWAATPSPSSSGDRQWPRAVRGAGDGAGPPAVRQRPRVRQRRPGGGPVPVAERRPAEGALLVRPSQASSRAPQPSSLVSPENKFITTTRRDRQTSPPHLSAQIWVAKGRQKVQNEPSQISLNRICEVWYSLCLSSPKPWNLSLLLCISPVLCSLPCICVCVFFVFLVSFLVAFSFEFSSVQPSSLTELQSHPHCVDPPSIFFWPGLAAGPESPAPGADGGAPGGQTAAGGERPGGAHGRRRPTAHPGVPPQRPGRWPPRGDAQGPSSPTLTA